MSRMVQSPFKVARASSSSSSNIHSRGCTHVLLKLCSGNISIYFNGCSTLNLVISEYQQIKSVHAMIRFSGNTDLLCFRTAVQLLLDLPA